MTVQMRVRALFVVFALVVGGLATPVVGAQELARPKAHNARPETTTYTESTLYTFCSLSGCTDGEYPVSALVQASDGNYYGTTSEGGGSTECANGCGTVFKITPAGMLTTLYSFCSVGGSSCTDGAAPLAGVIEGSDGNFYGTTSAGGNTECTGGCGTVFKVTPAGTLTTLYTFCSVGGSSCTDGEDPQAAVVEGSDGNFYGTTKAGGTDSAGTVFKVSSSGTFTSIYSFDVSTGEYPLAGLVQGSSGNFYGTTSDGGVAKNGPAGTVFEITPSGTLTTLFNFCSNGICQNGQYPKSGLVESSDGDFFGTTYGEESNCTGPGAEPICGTVFVITPSGSLSTLFWFAYEGDYAGAMPTATPVVGSDGNAYGTAGGAVYYYNASIGLNSAVYLDENAQAAMVQGSDGNFYGTANSGGASDEPGIIYEVTVSPALAGPVQLTLSNSSVSSGTPVTLSWRVVNGFSTTLQQCYAYVQGGYAAAGTWTGLQTGAISSGAYAGSATITPTDGGVYTYALTCGGMESGFATLTVSGGTLKVTTSSLPSDTVGVPYSQTLVAQGGTPPYTWSLVSGSLPAGLTLSSAGVISGTPTASGTSDFVVKVTDSASEPATATASLSITIVPTVLKFTTASLPGATLGAAYSETVGVTGGTPPYTWSVTSGSLPAGLTLNASTGVISGTPTTLETSTFTINVKDSGTQSISESLSIAVSAALKVATTSLPNAAIGTAYLQTVQAAGGMPPYMWSIASGSLPAGLSLASSTGVISGTPSSGATTETFTVEVSDSNGRSAEGTLTIAISATTTLTITTTFLGTGAVGMAYSATLSASGGTSPYTWSLSSGSLPAGLSLSGTTGVISGTPTAAGTSSFTVMVTDSASHTATASLSIVVNASATVRITTASLPNGDVGAAYSTTLAAVNGTKPYTWSIAAGSLPAGLSLNASTGVISGTPTTAGTYSVLVQVEDSASETATASYTVTISSAPQITTALLTTGAVGTAYSAQLMAVGGTAPYTWSIASGTLPAGLSLNASTGVISGTPKASATVDLTVKVTDAVGGSATAELNLAIYTSSIVRITTASLPGGTVGTPYSATLAATSGTKPYTWSIYSGSLPIGLSLNAGTGVISGTPTTGQTANFVVAVKGTGNYTATASFSITVTPAPPLKITTTYLVTGSVNIAYSATLQATGGVAPYTWSKFSGTLPPGLTLASNGVISGTPPDSGTYDFDVEVADSFGNTALASFSITIYGSTIVRITTTSLPNGTVGTAYSATLEATSGTKPYTWSVYSGSLPAGLSLNASTGVISGTPTTAGTTDFYIGVKGAGNNTATAYLSITVAQ